MKNISCRFALFILLLILLPILCSCSENQIEDINPDLDKQPIEITLHANEHPELHLGYANGERVIKDFVVDNAETYILQDDSSILCYDKNGNFIEKYDLNLAEQGLTAYKIACSNGTIYLLDGHNNAIITAKKDKVKNVSVLNFTDIGMVKNFYAQKKGTLIMSFSDLEGAYTVEVDPTGAEVEIVGEKQKGYLISENITYLPELIYDNDETNQLKAVVYKSGKKIDEFRIGTTEKNRSMAGLSIYGISNDNWFGILHEFVNDGETPEDEEYIQTLVSFNTEDGEIKTSESRFHYDEIINLSKEDTYCMSFSDETLTIKPISEYFSDWSNNEIYFLTKD